MRTVTAVGALCTALAELRDARGPRVALVPTMGNLHDGHIALVRAARAQADIVVVSVFVNPLQFAEGEDFADYPRTLAHDSERLQAEGVNLIFAPAEVAMYPHGISSTRVRVEGLSEILCGAVRPGHFEGVTTVVSMLFNLVRPDMAVFGRKDYQQLAIIRRMVADLHMPIEIVDVPTVREADGLARSSRNQYLTAEERAQAPELYATLQALGERLAAGERDYAALQADGAARLQAAGMRPDYLEIRAPDLARPAADAGNWVILAAAWLGRARLLDNLRVEAGN